MSRTPRSTRALVDNSNLLHTQSGRPYLSQHDLALSHAQIVQIVTEYLSHGNISRAGRSVGVATSTAHKYVKEYFEDRVVLPPGRPTGADRTIHRFVDILLTRNPHFRVRDVLEAIHVVFHRRYSPTQVWRIMRSLGFVRKRIQRIAKQRSSAYIVQERLAWVLTHRRPHNNPMRHLQRFYFLDESTIAGDDFDAVRGWGKVGEVLEIPNVALSRININLLMIHSSRRIFAHKFMETETVTCTKEVILKFLRDVGLPPGSILVLDNVVSHRGADVRDLALTLGITLLYLPPYSPEYNPIEILFGRLKALLRLESVSTIVEKKAAIERALGQFTEESIHNIVVHCLRKWTVLSEEDRKLIFD